VINKTDLAPFVGADVGRMISDAAQRRASRPVLAAFVPTQAGPLAGDRDRVRIVVRAGATLIVAAGVDVERRMTLALGAGAVAALRETAILGGGGERPGHAAQLAARDARRPRAAARRAVPARWRRPRGAGAGSPGPDDDGMLGLRPDPGVAPACWRSRAPAG